MVETPVPLTAADVRELLSESGRKVQLRPSPEGDTVEIHGPAGELELRIRLTEEGPVLSLKGQRIELDAAETIALRCNRFELTAREATEIRTGQATVHSDGALDLHAEGELRLRSEDELKAVANMIWLN